MQCPFKVFHSSKLIECKFRFDVRIIIIIAIPGAQKNISNSKPYQWAGSYRANVEFYCYCPEWIR